MTNNLTDMIFVDNFYLDPHAEIDFVFLYLSM